MNAIIFGLCMVFACAQKNVEKSTTEQEEVTLEKKRNEDCPPGVKIGCNVPSMTQEEVSTVHEQTRMCIEECIATRQMEAKSKEMIDEECQRGCSQKHFIGQVEVIPSLENPGKKEEPAGE